MEKCLCSGDFNITSVLEELVFEYKSCDST
jgi:hypothetical protein